MAKVSGGVDEIEEVETVEGVEEVAEETTKRKREDWQGGYKNIFDTVDECKANPVLTEAGEETDEFGLYHFTNNDTQAEHFTWARNNNEALINVVDAIHDYKVVKFGAQRGRRKMFKPDDSLVQLATSLKDTGDEKQIANFLSFMPNYRYIFDGSEMPGELN